MSWLIRSPYPDGATEHPYVVGVSSVYFSAETSKEIALPTGWQEGDLLVLEVWHWGAGTSVAQTISTSGWNYGVSSSFLRSAGTAWGWVQQRHKLATALEANPTITLPSSLYAVAFLTAYRTTQSLTVRQSKLLRDISSPYVTDSLDITSPAAVSIFAGASRSVSGSTYNPGTITINSDNHLIKHVSSGGSGRGALTHIDANTVATYGPYTNSWSNTVGETFGMVREVATYDKNSTIPGYIGSTADSANSLDHSMSISSPVGINNGDLLLLFLCVRGVSQANAENFSISNGWEQIATNYESSTLIRLYKKIADGGDSATFTWPGSSGNKLAMIVAYSNATEAANITVHRDTSNPMTVASKYMRSRGVFGIFTDTERVVGSSVGTLTITPTPDDVVQHYDSLVLGTRGRTMWYAGIEANSPALYPIQQDGSSDSWSCAFSEFASNQYGFLLEIR